MTKDEQIIKQTMDEEVLDEQNFKKLIKEEDKRMKDTESVNLEKK